MTQNPLPELIKTTRVRLHISQVALAHRLGVSPNTVARWERGVLAPRQPEILSLALRSMQPPPS